MIHENNFETINLHVGQRNLGSHAKNLRGEGSLSPYSDIVKLLQRVRDESHRFAVSYHTTLKRTAATKSVIEDIPGIGSVSRKKLMRRFGSLKAISAAKQSEIAAVVGEKRAAEIKKLLKL